MSKEIINISIFNKDKGYWKWNDNNDYILNIRTGESFYLRNSGAVEDLVDLLNEQQATISALKDIFKDIIAYSEWDSEKPYCSLGIAVDKKTYYEIRKILNE